jgi:hypothetical protein
MFWSGCIKTSPEQQVNSRENRELSRNREPFISGKSDPCRKKLCALHKKDSTNEEFLFCLPVRSRFAPQFPLYSHRITRECCLQS